MQISQPESLFISYFCFLTNTLFACSCQPAAKLPDLHFGSADRCHPSPRQRPLDMCEHSYLKLTIVSAFSPPSLYIPSPTDKNLTKCLQFKTGMLRCLLLSLYGDCGDVDSIGKKEKKSHQLSKVVVATRVLSHSDTETTLETHERPNG